MCYWEQGGEEGLNKTPVVCVLDIYNCTFASEEWGKFHIASTMRQGIVLNLLEMRRSDFHQIEK